MTQGWNARVFGLALLAVMVSVPADSVAGSAGGLRQRAERAGLSGAAPALHHAGRWQEKRREGRLPAEMRRILDREERKAADALLRKGRKPWQRMLESRPRIVRPAGLSPAVSLALDSLTASWVQHYSSGLAPSTDAITAITSDASGNIYATGYTTGIFTGSDFLTIKYNSAGVRQWVATYSGPGNDFDAAVAIAVDGSGNVFVTGSSFGLNTEEDYATIKYSPSGQQLWVARYNGPADDYDAPSGLVLDGSGQVMVAGVSVGVGTDGDYLTVKYSSGGTQLWARRYNGPANDFDIPVGLGIDLSGSVYVSGTSVAEDTWEDFVTVKYSFAGDEVWVRRYDGTGNDYDAVAAIAVDIAGNSYITGTSSNIEFDTDIVTIKYRANGDRDWLSVYSTPDETDEIASALCIDASRNVYVTGSSYGFGTGENYLTLKYSSNGGLRWASQYNGTASAYDAAAAVAVDNTGSVFVTGASTGLGSYDDMVTVKYSSLGVLLWTQRYAPLTNDYDAGSAIAVDVQGRVCVGGSTYGTVTDEDAVVAVYSTVGVVQWVNLHNGPGNSQDEAVAVTLDASGNVYVTGTSYDQVTQSDYATVKYSPAGVQLWVARYNGPGDGEDFASALVVDGAGNVYVTGTSLGEASGYDIATVKYTTNGVQAWAARYTGSGNGIDQGSDLVVDGSGNVYVTGSRTAAASGVDFVTIKYTASGAQSWVAAYNGPSDATDEAYGVALDPAGNVYVTGASYRDGFDYDCVTVRYTAAGSQQWVVRYNGPESGEDRGFGLAVDGAGVVVGGVTRSAASGYNMLMVRYNLSGAQQWVQTYHSAGTQDDILTAIAPAGAGFFCITGTSRSVTTGYDFVTLKYSSAGSHQWTAIYDNSESDDDVPTTLALDAAGNIYVSGYSFLAESGYDFATLKYSPAGAPLWLSRFDNPAQFNDESQGIAVDAAGNTYLAGYSETEEGSVYSVVKYEAPLLQFSRNSVVFPALQAGCRMEDVFVVRNPSATNRLLVTSIVSTDPSFTVTPAAFGVAPRESTVVTITFAPVGPGAKAGLLVVHHNALSTPDTVSVSGTGTGSGGGVLISRTHVPGWRLFALPVTVVCPMVVPFSYAFTAGYFRSDTIVNGRGYWTKRADPVMHFTGFPITAFNVPVAAGWNLIGGISSSVPVSSVSSIPDGIVLTAYFGYRGAYFFADTLESTFGYWVKASQAGQLVLHAGIPPAGPGAALVIPQDAGHITVADAAGNTQELHYLAGEEHLRLREYFELPPVPPEGAFDVRFGSGGLVEVAVGDVQREHPLLITGTRGPVTISWSPSVSVPNAKLLVGGGEVPLAGAGSMTIEDLRIPVALRLGAGGAVPVSFGLGQNFPNPFNPTTDISYALPVRSMVLLRVFDLLGRPVRTLVDGQVDAGSWSVRWDGRDGGGSTVAAGVYFYRIEAFDPGSSGRMLAETKKMLLLK